MPLFVGICRVLRLICNERYGGVQILGFLETVLTVIWLLVGVTGGFAVSCGWCMNLFVEKCNLSSSLELIWVI